MRSQPTSVAPNTSEALVVGADEDVDARPPSDGRAARDRDPPGQEGEGERAWPTRTPRRLEDAEHDRLGPAPGVDRPPDQVGRPPDQGGHRHDPDQQIVVPVARTNSGADVLIARDIDRPGATLEVAARSLGLPGMSVGVAEPAAREPDQLRTLTMSTITRVRTIPPTTA